MKAKTRALLDLIQLKKKELKEQKINKLIHMHVLKEQKRLSKIVFDPIWEKYEEKMSRYYMELDKRIDAKLNKDAAKIRKQLFGY